VAVQSPNRDESRCHHRNHGIYGHIKSRRSQCSFAPPNELWLAGVSKQDFFAHAPCDESVEKTDCYHVQGEGKAKRRFELWFGKTDYLIRKVRTTYPDLCDEEVHQNIKINEQISSDMFVFTPMKPSEIPAKN